MYPRATPTALPLPPSDALERFHVREPSDTRFRANARLLQSIWREGEGLEMGSYAPADGVLIPLGSRLGPAPAKAGYNYLTPDIARLVRREIAYRERGALIEEERAWSNLLSSTALVFNLLGPLKLNAELARQVFSSVLPLDIASIDGIWFETSPGRGDAAYIGDHTALDALVAYTSVDSKTGMIGIEVKYAEGVAVAPTPATTQTMAIAKQSGLFIDPTGLALQAPRLRQFLAEHTLCHAIVHGQRHFDTGHFIVIAPTYNTEIGTLTQEYRAQLAQDQTSILPFVPVGLERVVALIHDNGQAELGRKLDKRYLDFSPVFNLVDEWEPHL